MKPPYATAWLSSASCGLLSVNVVNVVAFSWSGCWRFLCAIAEDAVAYTLIISVYAPLAQEIFPFFGVKHFFSPVYPAASQPGSVGCVKQVAHYQGAVVDICWAVSVGQNHQNHRGAVERVALRYGNVGIEL